MIVKKFSLCFFIFVAASIFLIGCGLEKKKTASNEIFTSDTSEKIESSVITLPSSVSSQPSSKNIREISRLTKDNNSGSGMEGIFSGVRCYIGMADMFGGFAKELMVDIVKSSILQYAKLGEIIIIPDDPSNPNAPKKVKVEKPDAASDAEPYVWKVSLYYTAESENPEMIIRFTLEGAGAKGRILWTMTETDSKLVDAGITGLPITRYVDMTFDGTGDTKNLEVKVIQDLGGYFEYAETNWATLTPEQKDALDLGQPGKVFVNASYDGTIYTIYGTSYHPGWAKEAQLNGETLFWGENRSMYMFASKATELETVEYSDGAILNLALPLQTMTDVTNVWTEDSIGEIFTDLMLNQLNAMIQNLHTGTPIQQLQANAIVTWIRASSVLGAPNQESDFTITKAQLEAFVNDPNAISSDSESFKAQYNAIAYLINPAFFDSVSGFLGTYNVTKDLFYNYASGTLAPGDKPGCFEKLFDLYTGLSSIAPYVPADVVNAGIVVQ